MSFDNSYSREEQAIPTLGKSSHTLSNQRCTKCVFWVNNDMTAHLMRKGPVLYCHIPASGLPVHNFLSFHHEMLDGQKMGKSRRLKIKSSHSASALSCNAVLSEYPCLQKKKTPRFPKLVWALAQSLATPAEGFVSQMQPAFPILLIRLVNNMTYPGNSWLPQYRSAKPSLARGGEHSWREMWLLCCWCSAAHLTIHCTRFWSPCESAALLRSMDGFAVAATHFSSGPEAQLTF